MLLNLLFWLRSPRMTNDTRNARRTGIERDEKHREFLKNRFSIFKNIMYASWWWCVYLAWTHLLYKYSIHKLARSLSLAFSGGRLCLGFDAIPFFVRCFFLFFPNWILFVLSCIYYVVCTVHVHIIMLLWWKLVVRATSVSSSIHSKIGWFLSNWKSKEKKKWQIHKLG